MLVTKKATEESTPEAWLESKCGKDEDGRQAVGILGGMALQEWEACATGACVVKGELSENVHLFLQKLFYTLLGLLQSM